jgi:hypothetical protein
MPLNTAGLNALPRELGSHGSAVNNTIRQLSGAIGTAVVITVFTMQATSHASELSSDAYVFMLSLSFVALIIACFMPKKAAIKKSEGESQN